MIRPGWTDIDDLARKAGLKRTDVAAELKASDIRFAQRGLKYWIRKGDVRKLLRRIKLLRKTTQRTRDALQEKWSLPITGNVRAFLHDTVYLIGCGEFVKIGFANNPRYRLRILQLANPHQLELLATLPGGPEIEQQLHVAFGRYHHRGEWFRLEGELALYVERLRRKATPESRTRDAPEKTPLPLPSMATGLAG
jgi:hypothetical protein